MKILKLRAKRATVISKKKYVNIFFLNFRGKNKAKITEKIPEKNGNKLRKKGKNEIKEKKKRNREKLEKYFRKNWSRK